jgi:4-hydroxybutyrate CoA-transferase
MPKNPNYVDATDAIKLIKSGDRITLPLCCGLPQTLVEGLVDNKRTVENVEIVTGLQFQYPFLEDGLEESFSLRTWQCTPGIRHLLKKGNVKYIPIRQGQANQFFSRNGPWPLKAALIQVTLPNKHGYCSVGVSHTHTLPMALNAEIIIAQVNDQMPWVLGDTFIHVTQLDYLVNSSRPLLEYRSSGRVSEVDRAIARNVADLIPNEATIEIGIGSVPEAVLRALEDHKNLRFIGMVTDGMVDLVDAGAVSTDRTLNRQAKMIASEIMGTKRVFEFVDNNPLVEGMHSLINPRNLGKIDKFISILGAIEVDITGQVNAETVRGEQFSAVGGSFDWLQGAVFSEGGKSIIAIPSRTQNGKISRIVPQLPKGSAVTHPRHTVQFIVTEYGVAELQGRSLRERAEALVSIAHPDFRDELTRSIGEIV